MSKKRLRILSLFLAVLTAFSVLTVAASAAETQENEADEQRAAAFEEEKAEIAAAGAALDEDADEPAAVGAGAPVITALEPCQDGVILRWDAVSGVPSYRVYRWYDDGRGWVKLKETTNLYYVDKSVISGGTYQYRLVGINAAGSIITPSVTRSLTYYAVVRITDAEAASNGLRVTWNKETAVSKVAVYRMNGGSWHKIAVSSDTSYLDKNVSYGNEYRYTVRALDANGNFLQDYYDETGVTIRYLATPSPRVESAAGGVKISWNAVEGAESYRIFVKNSQGSWARLVTTTDTSYLDKDVSSGVTYTYTVRCVSVDGKMYTSYCDTTGKSVNYIAAPVLLSADGTNDGIRISWKSSAGAAKYRVFYKNSQGGWSRLGDTTSTSMLDEEVRSGVTYTYTVRCMNASGDYISAYDTKGVSGVYLSAPVFSVSNGADGVDVSWGAVSGAVNYRVYYYGSRGWTKLTDTTATSYTDTDVSSGTAYTYTVRCINAEGTEFTSGFLAGKSVTYYAAPKLTLTNAEDGVNIKWNAVGGAQKYRLYYRGSSGWIKMLDTAGTSYLDKDVTSGHTYTYTVRCINNAGNAFMSYFKPGASKEFIAAPRFSLTRNEKSITVNWDKVGGAALYRVYRRGENGWVKQTDTIHNYYEDKNVISGSTYTYTVRCLNAEGTEFTSDYREGKSMRIVDMPRIASVENTTEGVEIHWSESLGASKYRVYCRSSSGWTKIGETSQTVFVHTAAESGKDYTYTVRCINLAGTEFESTFDSVGKSIHYIASPKNMKAESYLNSIKISWTASAGAEKYRVYYYGSKGWTKLTETTDTSVIDDDVTSGYTYRYTVRCITADGKSFTSDCDTNGAVCKFTKMPVLKPLDYTKDGVKISWSSSAGAEKYRVYYYGARGWSKIAETTDTSVEDKTVSSGTTCRYTVRCITSDGKNFTSDCDTTGVSIYYVAAPRMLSADTGSSSATITWNKPNGASKFRVYKRVSGSWQRQTDTTSTSFTDYNVSAGNTYTYTVRVINNSGTEFYSGFDPDGFSVTVTAGSPSGSFVYYDQGDYNYPYGDDTIAYSGCGPTCFAMIASTLTGRTITPIDAVSWCGNSYYMMGVGTYWSYFAAASDRFGITMERQLGQNEWSSVVSALKQGKYVISAQSSGIFTRGGHFIVLAGITSSGKIIVYDPNGGNHYVGTAFSQSDITASGTQYWVFSR